MTVSAVVKSMALERILYLVADVSRLRYEVSVRSKCLHKLEPLDQINSYADKSPPPTLQRYLLRLGSGGNAKVKE